jgi:rubrerythrin
MTNQDLNLLDAIQMAMEAEQKAAAFYTDAAQKAANPVGRELSNQNIGGNNGLGNISKRDD